MSLTPDELFDRVTELAAEKKTSVAQVLRDAKLNEKWLRDTKTDQSYPTLDTLARIADALGISVASLLSGIPDANLKTLGTLGAPERKAVSLMIDTLAAKANASQQ